MIFNKTKLKDISLRITKGTTPPSSSFGKNEINYIKSDSLSYSGFIDNKCFVTIDKEMHETKLKRSILLENDILYSIAGMNLGKVGIVEKEYLPANTNQAVAIISCNDKVLMPKYLFYWLLQKKVVDYVNSGVSQSAQPNINLAQVGNLEMKYPFLDDQIKIVYVLDNITKKIKVNDEINNNLHELICNYYSQYYECEVEDKFIYKAKELLSFDSGTEPGSKNYQSENKKNCIKFYRVGDMLGQCNTYVDKELIGNNIVTKNDIVVSFDATIGRVAYGLNGGFSTGMRRIRSNNNFIEIPSSFIYAYFNSKKVIETIKEHARGTTILHAGTSINHLDIKINKNIDELFYNITPLFNKMLLLKRENETLSQLRNTLLPKLMNGEIDLDNI